MCFLVESMLMQGSIGEKVVAVPEAVPEGGGRGFGEGSGTKYCIPMHTDLVSNN